jgi:8-oxo-dGTP diphosphatase
MQKTIHRALAYITNANRLLVFRQPDFPEAGIQVPGGTLEPGEIPIEGVLREGTEETGLADLAVNTFLGDHVNTCNNTLYHRYFFHLTCPGNPPETWQHYELFPSIGDPTPILFDLFWVPLPDGVPPLKAEMDRFVPKLNEVLGFAPDLHS